MIADSHFLWLRHAMNPLLAEKMPCHQKFFQIFLKYSVNPAWWTDEWVILDFSAVFWEKLIKNSRLFLLGLYNECFPFSVRLSQEFIQFIRIDIGKRNQGNRGACYDNTKN